MKTQDITIGKKYTDNKGNVREVIGVGPGFKLYPSQQETDCLGYCVIAKRLGHHMVGEIRNSTRTSFANWAKSEVP